MKTSLVLVTNHSEQEEGRRIRTSSNFFWRATSTAGTLQDWHSGFGGVCACTERIWGGQGCACRFCHENLRSCQKCILSWRRSQRTEVRFIMFANCDALPTFNLILASKYSPPPKKVHEQYECKFPEAA